MSIHSVAQRAALSQLANGLANFLNKTSVLSPHRDKVYTAARPVFRFGGNILGGGPGRECGGSCNIGIIIGDFFKN